MPTTIAELTRSLFKATEQEFTVRDVAKAAREAGLSPRPGVVATALWRMSLFGELQVINATDAYRTGGKHRLFVFFDGR